MKIKSILTKTTATVALSLAGIAAVNSANNTKAQAAIVQNDAAIYTVHTKTTVFNKYEHGRKTGQVLDANTSWKVIKTAYDHNGDKWYDLGKNQWVKAEKPVQVQTAASNAAVQTQNTQTVANNNYSAPVQTQTSSQSSSASNYTSSATGSEAAAKAWIAQHESGGSYTAVNSSSGAYGKYQLLPSYLHGNYSAANQERVADQYVKSRYGSWSAAAAFHRMHGYY